MLVFTDFSLRIPTYFSAKLCLILRLNVNIRYASVTLTGQWSDPMTFG